MQILIHIRGGFSLARTSVIAVVKHFRVWIILALACLACILISVPAVSQISLPGNTLKLGVRTSAYPLGNNVKEPYSAEGFCGTFGKELQKELASKGQPIKIKYFPIVNQHKGPSKPRYDGLKKGEIDIECGPNSISSGNLPSGEGIEFSQSFYKTGVKLLLKEELAKKLNSELIELNEITIGVIRESTTLQVLKNIKDIKFFPYDIGRQALNALEANEVHAFANDALIVGTLLKNGVNQPGQPSRPPYENLGYTIYPNSSSKSKYLTSNPTEEYAMAVKENRPFFTDLLKSINSTLNKPKFSSERQRLKEYETRSSDTSWTQMKNNLRFINNLIWFAFVTFISAFFIQYLSKLLHQSWLTTLAWGSVIATGLSLVLMGVIQIILLVIPLIFPGY